MSDPTKQKSVKIVAKFESGEYRLIQERNDFFLPQIISFIEEQKWRSLIPDYQRRPVWDDAKKSLFIESMILNIPIPPIFLFEYELGRYEIMDGQQRTSAIREFYSGDLKLKGLETWKELNGMGLGDLPSELKQALSRRRISATVIINETVAFGSKKWGELDLRREVFSRLNSGGVNLTAQELRNSLYSGHLNTAIIRMAAMEEFTKSWGIPSYKHTIRPSELPEKVRSNSKFKRMKDCEYVLRFLTLREPSRLKGSVKQSMDSFMRDHMECSVGTANDLAGAFENCVKISKYIFGSHNFSVRNESGKWITAVQAYDGMMLAIDRLKIDWASRTKSWKDAGKEYQELIKKESFRDGLIERRTSFASVERHVKTFLDILKPHVSK